MDYTIAAIPTIYRGRQYRSRLEARWAAYFDLLGLTAEYEPFDLGCWSPDFQVSGSLGGAVLVEVKPFFDLDPAVCGKVTKAWADRKMGDPLCGVMVTRLAPVEVWVGRTLGVSLGWSWQPPFKGLEGQSVPSREGGWAEAIVHWKMVCDECDYERPTIACSLAHVTETAYSGLLSFERRDDPVQHLLPCVGYTLRRWAEATNLVQWKGPGQ